MSLNKIEAAYSELVGLWEEKGPKVITVWKEMGVTREERAKCVGDGVKPKKDYPEVRSLLSCTLN